MMKNLAVFAIFLPVAAAAQSEKPNVIVVYIDDMGYADIGCYGSTITPTPNMDRIGSEGIRFNQYYSAAPVSSASRVGVTTGQFPMRWGINTFLATKEKNHNCEQRDYLDSSAPSMARAFKEAGYATAHFGKWHMGGGRDVKDAPMFAEYGFDEYTSTFESPDADPKITPARGGIWSANDEIKRWERTRYFVDKTLNFIEKKKDNTPFFINLWPDDVHTPWVPDSFYSDNVALQEDYKPLSFVLAELDVQIGRLLDGLEQMGVAENTILLFTSDNGPSPSFGQCRTAGMRGWKNSLYEGGIKLPFMVRYPDKIKAGMVDDNSVICSVDLYPTLCAMAGIESETGVEFDGQDISDAILTGEGVEREKSICWDFGRNEFFNRPNIDYHVSPHLAIRRGAWKLLINSDGSDIELYNIEQDPYETQNLSESESQRIPNLKKEVLEWYATRPRLDME